MHSVHALARLDLLASRLLTTVMQIAQFPPPVRVESQADGQANKYEGKYVVMRMLHSLDC